MKFAALGRTERLYDSILKCVDAGHVPVLIATAAPAPEYARGEDDFAALAQRFGCRFHRRTEVEEPGFPASMQDCGAQVGISVNWPVLLRRPLIDAFPLGIVNAHAGDLPRYRGNACPNWAILRGEDAVVLTLHAMTEELDGGDILLQRRMPLSNDAYIGDVYRFLDGAVPELFLELLNGLDEGTIVPKAQSATGITPLRCFPRRPEDSRIDWREPAERIARLVRASARPFAGAYSFLEGGRVTVWRARAGVLDFESAGIPGQVAEVNPRSGEVKILCGSGILVLEEIETAVAGRIKPAAILVSQRMRLGRDLADEVNRLRRHVAELKAAAKSADGK